MRVFSQGYPTMSPQHDSLMSSSLPPMSTFRGGQQVPPTSSSNYSSTSPTLHGTDLAAPPSAHPPNAAAAPPGGSQTGDALGKALGTVSEDSQVASPVVFFSQRWWHQALI